MNIKIAAAAPDMSSGQLPLSEAVLDAVRRARAEEAALLVLPAGLPKNLDTAAIQEAAGPMPVYPITAKSLSVCQLREAEDLDILCCSSHLPATASSYYENAELAGLVSYDKNAVVVLASPKGGDGHAVYTGQCVIAENGHVLADGTDYVCAELNPARKPKPPETGTIDSQPVTPWTPLPEMLPRIRALQVDALTRKMQTVNARHVSLSLADDVPSLLALIVCTEAMDGLGLPRENIHAEVTGIEAPLIAEYFQIQTAGKKRGLRISSTDLTARVLNAAEPPFYAVNGSVPHSVIQLMLLSYAATCGDRTLSTPLRAVLDADTTPWQMYDFLLYFSMNYGFSKDVRSSLLTDTFYPRYKKSVISSVRSDFFRRYHRPAPMDGPLVFKACLPDELKLK